MNRIPIIVLSFSLTSPSWAKTTPQTQVHVKLLGKPCLLQGPFDEPTLNSIHSIGPDQIYPSFASPDSQEARQTTRQAIDKVKTVNNQLPSVFDRYREKLAKRLEAQLAFLDALKLGKSEGLIKAARKYLEKNAEKRFETLLKKKTSAKETQDQLFEIYNDGIEPDPEEEFHRALKKLNVQYTCSFE